MLPEELQRRIAQEFRFVAERMQDSPDPRRKLFYFSALYAELQRDSNWFWERELAVLRLAIEATYQQLNGRSEQMRSLAPLNDDFYNWLTQVAEDLASYFEEGKDDKAKLFSLVGRITELGHVATGNGHYLLEKGVIKL